jgi:hypothetical protein
MEQVELKGIRRFFCWIFGHRISRSDFNASGVPNPEKEGDYCHQESTCMYCRDEVNCASFG